VGWVVDEPVLLMPGAARIKTRVTAAPRWEDDRWKVVHAHFSVGVPDDEVVELQTRWSS
jgi:hypothetical protein